MIDENLIRKAIDNQIDPKVIEIAKGEGIASGQVSSLRLDYHCNRDLFIKISSGLITSGFTKILRNCS